MNGKDADGCRGQAIMFLKSRHGSAACGNNGLRGKYSKMDEMGETQLRPRNGRDSSLQARVHFRKSHSGMPKMEGYLKKRITKLNLKWFWRKFWFVLDGKSLLYFKSQSNYKALGTCRGLIDFGLVQAVRSTHESKKCYGLEIITYSDIIHLCADDKETRDVWVTALQGAIGVGEVSWPFGVQLSNNAHLKELRDEGTSDRPGPQCPIEQAAAVAAAKEPKVVKAEVHQVPTPPPQKGKRGDKRPSSDTTVPAKRNTLRRIRSFSFGKLKKSRIQGFFRQLSGKEIRPLPNAPEVEKVAPQSDVPPKPAPLPRDVVEDVNYDVGYATIGEPEPDYDRVTVTDAAPEESTEPETFRVSVRIPVMSYYSQQDNGPAYAKINKKCQSNVHDIEEVSSGEGLDRSVAEADTGDVCNIYTDAVTHVTKIYCRGPQRRHSFDASSNDQNSFPIYQKVNKRRKAQRSFSLDDAPAARDADCTRGPAFRDAADEIDGCSCSVSHIYESCSLSEACDSRRPSNTTNSDSASAHVYEELEYVLPDTMHLPRVALRTKRCIVEEDTECYYSSISEEDVHEAIGEKCTGESVARPVPCAVQTQTSFDSETADDSTYETATLNDSFEELAEMEYFEDNPHIIVTKSDLFLPKQKSEELHPKVDDLADVGSGLILREMENLLIHGH